MLFPPHCPPVFSGGKISLNPGVKPVVLDFPSRGDVGCYLHKLFLTLEGTTLLPHQVLPRQTFKVQHSGEQVTQDIGRQLCTCQAGTKGVQAARCTSSSGWSSARTQSGEHTASPPDWLLSILCGKRLGPAQIMKPRTVTVMV